MASYQHDTIKVGDKVYEATEALCGDGGEVETESITVTPKTIAQTILPSEDKLIDKVDVTAVDRTIDINIQPENIKKGVDILGVEGNITPATTVDRLQWKCDNMKSLAYEFYNYKGTDYSILEGLDTSKVTIMNRMFYLGDTNYSVKPPTINILTLNYLSVESMDEMFSGNNPSEELINSIDYSNVVSMKGFLKQSRDDFEHININLPKCQYLNDFLSSFGTGYYNRNLKSLEITLGTLCNLSGLCKHREYDRYTVTINNSYNIKNLESAFYSSGVTNIYDNGKEQLDLLNVHSLNLTFSYSKKITNLNLINTENITSYTSVFSYTGSLKSLKTLNLINCTEFRNDNFQNNNVLETLIFKNIKISISIGALPKISNASLLNTAQELWDNTDNALGGARTLTLHANSKTAIQSIYVKLITPTAEQEAEDPYINNKKPCVECTSTDEGAMTLEEYIISKNWSIA